MVWVFSPCLSQVADDIAIDLYNPYNRTGHPYHDPRERAQEEEPVFGVHRTKGFVFFVESEVWEDDIELGFEGWNENDRNVVPNYRIRVVFGDD